MKRIICLAAAALLAAGSSASAMGFKCLNCGIHCMEPHEPPCLGCEDRCDCHGGHCCNWKNKHAEKYIATLQDCNACCCDRICAAEKLGHRCLADYCCCPDVLSALVTALQDDSCWEVRKAAAWSIAMQGARNQYAILSLYLSSKLDPHYLVRDKAAEALSILLVCRTSCCCYKELFDAADELVAAVRPRKIYRPGQSKFSVNFVALAGGVGLNLTAPLPPDAAPPGMPAGVTPEPIPAPRPGR